jgi:hypothetical protein
VSIGNNEHLLTGIGAPRKQAREVLVTAFLHNGFVTRMLTLALDLHVSPLWREGVLTEAVTLADLPVASVNEYLRPMLAGNLACTLSRLALSIDDYRRTGGARTLDRPAAISWNYVLVSLCHEITPWQTL